MLAAASTKRRGIYTVTHAKIIDGASAFEQLQPQWDALAKDGITDTPFQTLAYQAAWWQHLQPEGSTLLTIAVNNDDSELIGIGCFYLLDETIYFNASMEETDYLDIVCREEDAEAVWTAVFDCLCSPSAPKWNKLDLYNLPQASPSRSYIKAESEKRGFLFAEEQAEVCPVIPLPDSFDGYLANIDSKQRREIKRKIRRSDAANAKMVMVSQEDDIEQAVNDFLDLLQKSTFEKRDWLNEGRTALFHDTARAAQQAGTLQLLFMELEGEKAAALFNFDYNGRIWVYNSGLDPDSYGALSLGVVMTAKAIEWAAENGRSTFDFLRGNETYKYRFGAEDTTIYRQQITRTE